MTSVWPFTRAQLTAGLRRYYDDTRLQVEAIEEIRLEDRRPSVGSVRGLRATFRTVRAPQTIDLVVKEPLGTTRAGLAGVGRREAGLYQSLASQLPVSTPQLVAADPLGGWLILEHIQDGLPPAAWTADDYLAATRALAGLHERFWDLGEDLSYFPWLGRPLFSDFEIHVRAAAQAVEQIVAAHRPGVIAASPEWLGMFATLISEVDKVVAPLREAPQTLLHGDYWPGNIARLPDGDLLVYDWQLAVVGPCILDLVVLVNSSRWWFSPLPLDPAAMVRAYRAEIAERLNYVWDNDTWGLLWDHALMWRFIQEWVDLLAASPSALIEARADLLEEVWLAPVHTAVSRRLSDR